MFDMDAFGRRLRDLRRDRGLTQEELARRLAVTPQSVSRWECGFAMPDVDHLCVLANLFGTSVDRLLGVSRGGSRAYIGIDGGGTKTEFALIDREGHRLSSIVLEGSNPNTCGIEQTLAVLRRGIDYLGPEQSGAAALFFGGAGMLTGGAREQIRARLEESYPYLRVGVHTDILNVIACCSSPQRCLAAIGGTGCVVFSYDGEELVRTGGLGWRFEGSGSGYELGRDAIAAALRHRDGTGPATALTHLVEERLECGVLDAIQTLYAMDNAAIAAFAPLVFAAAERGDRVAGELLDRSCRHMARLIATAAQKTPGVDTLILSGSLFTRSGEYRRRVEALLPGRLKVECISCPPVWGACLQAARLAGAEELPRLENYLKKA